MNANGNRPRRGRTGRQGFTLIELLAAVTILMVIVSMMAVVFTESDRAWKLGTGRAESNTEGRAAINMIAQDLQYALADDVLSFVMRVDRDRARPSGLQATRQWPPFCYGFTNSEICFVSLQNPDAAGDDSSRATRQIYYWIREASTNDSFTSKGLNRYELVRTELTTLESSPGATTRAYHNNFWFDVGADHNSAVGSGVIAENVTGLAFFAPGTNGVMTRNYYSISNNFRLPEYVDVYLEVLGEEDAQRAADMQEMMGLNNQVVSEFVEKNARRYTTRVFFQNRAGYRNRL